MSEVRILPPQRKNISHNLIMTDDVSSSNSSEVDLPPEIEAKLPDQNEDEESIFTKIADKVSFGMGTPINIGAWILMVLIWFLLFGLGILTAHSNVLPAWFTSNAFNFPLNTVTTLAELYIGFLVAAAANRTERADRALFERVEAMESLLLVEVKRNTDLTSEIHSFREQDRVLLEEIHKQIGGESGDLSSKQMHDKLDEISPRK
jgi:uncharacterized membrane protein